MSSKIIIKGARVHNLKNINLEIPLNKLVVLTGLSGSGKSSLAFDTIYAEAQRRYIESLSSFARQFLGVMEKPDADEISGLPPAISIDPRTIWHNPRSTLGTMTEIYDLLRLIFARIGEPHCPKCGGEISSQSPEQIIKKILTLSQGEYLIFAPLVRGEKGNHKTKLAKLKEADFGGVRVDGELLSLAEVLARDIPKNERHNIEVVVERFVVRGPLELEEREHLKEVVKKALDLGDGLIIVYSREEDKDFLFSQYFVCAKCQIDLGKIEPRSFSFNSPHGACSHCRGLGVKLVIDPELLIPNPRLTLAEGALKPWLKIFANQASFWQILREVAQRYNFSENTPLEKLTPEQRNIILYGEKSGGFAGAIPILEQKYKELDSEYIRKEIENYTRELTCPLCSGQRLKKESLAVTVAGKNISKITDLTIIEAIDFFNHLIRSKPNNKKIQKRGRMLLAESELKIARPIIKEILARLNYLKDIGLGYLTIGRKSSTLAGGEAARIRLASLLSSSLVGVVYILDEPSIGLHQRDLAKLLTSLKKLRDLGNSIIVVEHDRETMLIADHIIDIGPGAGQYGGEIVAQGAPEQIMKNQNSLTGKYLAGLLEIAVPKTYRRGNGQTIFIKGAAAFNLKKVDVEIPLGKFVCITGVSGSGKSTLMIEILAKALERKFYRAKDLPGKHQAILGTENINKVIHIDQTPIGRTPRSNPATYTGLFNYIRDLFKELPEAKIKSYQAGKFSFNVRGGRCETCAGEGFKKIEMQFLSDVYIECEDCQGCRYNKEALEVHFRGKNIAEILEMSVEEAISFFGTNTVPMIYEKLKIFKEVGLGYIHLGQAATTLSGGEAQRVKLATELSRRATGKTLYILDEPTTGLHFDDVRKLLEVLNRLIDKGNTVLVIEHNLDLIKNADWIIDLGPEGGAQGGCVVAEGTPEEVARAKGSHTGNYLKKILK